MFSVVTGSISFSFLLIDFQGYVWYNYLYISFWLLRYSKGCYKCR